MTSLPPPYEHPGSPPARPELPEGIDRPPPPPRDAPRDELPRWTWWGPIAGLLLALVIAIAGATVIAVVAELAGVDINTHDTPPGITIGGTVIQDVGLIVAAVVFAKVAAGSVTARDFGLRRVDPLPAVGWTVLAWVSFFAFSAIWAALLNIKQDDDLPQELGAGDSTLNLVVVAVLVCVIAPICEEFFFRGFCFTALRRAIKLWPAAIVTGLIFGGIHASGTDSVFLVPLAFFGFALCVLYWRTGSLLPCMALHALNNSLALGVAQHFSVIGTVALMLGASSVVVSIGSLAARSRRLNAVPAGA
jgi:membrane protease YdiL (CAAX protease family)